MPGHLATLTSQEENDFVWQTFQKELYWLGGFQVRRAKKVDRGWRWITGERWWRFTNWDSGEPNDGGRDIVEDGEENFLQFHYHRANGKWNDIWTTSEQPGYMIEYEEMPEQTLAPILPEDIHQSQLTSTWANLKQAR